MSRNWKLWVIPVTDTAYKEPWGSQVFRGSPAALPITSKKIVRKKVAGKTMKMAQNTVMWQKYDYMWFHSASCSLAFLLHFSVTVALIFLQDLCFGQCEDSLNIPRSLLWCVFTVCGLSLFAPKPVWLIFPCLFHGTAHGRAWKDFTFTVYKWGSSIPYILKMGNNGTNLLKTKVTRL